MIKRTLCFSNPAYLSLRNGQLVIQLPAADHSDKAEPITHSVPIEDIGVVLLEERRITISNAALNALLQNNCAVISCDERHMPSAMFLPLEGHSVQSERFRNQIDASLPLKKQLWQQTIQAKIRNQAAVLQKRVGAEVGCMLAWAKDVKSGDSDNLEGRAAAYYWKNVFAQYPSFVRGREDDPPNNLLNYGYAILRAVVARALVAGGLLPTLGIHHHNRYNAYCLADDIMEPYRPIVDDMVITIVNSGADISALNKEIKVHFLSLPTADVHIGEQRCVLMNAVAQSVASLNKCFSGEVRKLVYPEL